MRIDLDAERRETGRETIEIVVGGESFSIEEPTLDKLGELVELEKRFGSASQTDEDLDRFFELLFGADAAPKVKSKVRISEVQSLFGRVFEWITEEREAKKAPPAADSPEESPAD